MLVLPSVGASVTKIVLNESATKAKLFFDDGSATIISTKNTPNTNAVKKTTITPNGTVVKKKIVKSTNGNSGIKAVTKKSYAQMMEATSPQAMANRAGDVIERAKRRAAMLESKTMDASQIAAVAMQDGQEVEFTPPAQ